MKNKKTDWNEARYYYLEGTISNGRAYQLVPHGQIMWLPARINQKLVNSLSAALVIEGQLGSELIVKWYSRKATFRGGIIIKASAVNGIRKAIRDSKVFNSFSLRKGLGF